MRHRQIAVKQKPNLYKISGRILPVNGMKTYFSEETKQKP